MIITAVVNDKVRMNNYRAKFQVQSIYCSEDIGRGSRRSRSRPKCQKNLDWLRVKAEFPMKTFIVIALQALIERYIIV